jgi:hypothetical protein
MGLTENVAAARMAEGWLAQLGDEVAEAGKRIDREHFYLSLATLAAAEVGKIVVEDGPSAYPMSDTEAAKFDNERVPQRFKYGGSPVVEVPPDYWVALTEDAWWKRLLRYLRSPYYRRRHKLG